MRASNLVKQELLTKWISGLKKCYSPAKSMSVIERKNVIKLSAYIAMAAVRGGATCWSRAIIAQASSRRSIHKLLSRRVLNKARYRPYKPPIISPKTTNTIVRSRARILSGSRIKMNQRHRPSVKRRTEMLKTLVPGGDLMEDKCLIRETLDYIVYLRAQVEVMRKVAAGGVARTLVSNDHRNNVVNK